jgi:DNA-binding CsgD family transcriptional regulator/tetratricopeptide (TPR) repeat protein
MPARGAPVLVGREQEMTRLEARWSDAAQGEPAFIVVTGHPGVGKTRLVQELIARCRDDTILTGDCLPMLDGTVPYAPLIDALAPLQDHSIADGDDLRHLLLRGGASQAELFSAVRAALTRAATEGPVLFVLEDMHWADRSTLQVVTYLDRVLRRAVADDPGSRVMVVMTRRSDLADALPGVVDFFAEILRSPLVEEFRLEGLDPSDLTSLLRNVAGDDTDARRLAAIAGRADGNPFLALELLAGGDTELPTGTREMLSHRLLTLSQEGLHVANAASVLGLRCDHELLATVASLHHDDLFAGTRAAVSTGVLVADDDSYRFRHALLQEVTYQQLLPGERALLHKRAAAALVSAGGSPGPIAQHFRRAHDPASALHWYVRAAKENEDRGAPDEAATAYLEAVSIWGSVTDAVEQTGLRRLDLLERAGSACDLAGRFDASADLYDEAGSLDAEGSVVISARLHVKRAWSLFNVGEERRATAAYEQAVALVTDRTPDENVANILTLYATGLIRLGRSAEALDVSRRSLDIARSVGADREIAGALSIFACATDVEHGAKPAEPIYREAIARWQALNDPDELLATYGHYQESLGCAGAVEESIDLARLAAETVRGTFYEFSPRMLVLYSGAAYNAFKLGRWDECDELAALAVPIGELTNLLPFAIHARIPILLARGRLEEAERTLTECSVMTGYGIEFHRQYQEWFSELRLRQRRTADAISAVLVGLDFVASTSEEPRLGRLILLGLRACAEAAEQARATGRPSLVTSAVDEGRGLLDRAREMPTSPFGTATPTHVVTTKAVRAQASAEEFRLIGEDDPDAWLAASDEWAALGRPHPAASCLIRSAYAGAGSRMPKPEVAIRLRQGYEWARDVGAEPLAQEASDLAERARISLESTPTSPSIPAQEATPPALAALTAREREVLFLLAEGLTNGQIARRLVISPHTVNVHVSRILMKLGVSSRVQAAGIAQSLRFDQASAPQK